MHWGTQMTHDTEKDMEELDGLLAEASARPPEVPAGLMERVVSDARATRPIKPHVQPQGQTFFGVLRQRFGQWGAVGGLVAASSVGFWFGIDPPSALEGVSIVPFVGDFGGDAGGAAELSGFGWDLEES